MASHIHNAFRGKDAPAREAKDYLLRFGLDVREQSQSLFGKLKSAFGALKAYNESKGG